MKSMDLDNELIEFILPKLIEFRNCFEEGNTSHPTSIEIKELEDWTFILDKMIQAFKILDGRRRDEEELDESKDYEIEEGLELFSKYFTSLWC